MAKIFQVPMFKLSRRRYVHLAVEGVKTQFLVDTNTYFSFVTPDQVRAWGVERRVREATELDEYPWVDVKVALGGCCTYARLFIRESSGPNRIGLDILSEYSCIIDFQQDTVTVRYREDVRKSWIKKPLFPVEINGRKTRVQLATGANAALFGPAELAIQARIPLREIN